MNDERWQETVGRIKDTFTVIGESVDDLEDGSGKRESIEFESPLGRIKLERTTRRAIVGTRGLGSRRIGSSTKVTHTFSATDIHQYVKAYRWQNDDWIELDSSSILTDSS